MLAKNMISHILNLYCNKFCDRQNVKKSSKIVVDDCRLNLKMVKTDPSAGKVMKSLAKKKILFHQENMPIHKSAIAVEKLNELLFEIIPRPLYFRTWTCGKKFSVNTNETISKEKKSIFLEHQYPRVYLTEMVETLLQIWITNLNQNLYYAGIEALFCMHAYEMVDKYFARKLMHLLEWNINSE